ncbi:MAG: antitoxin family protein [Deltaproteobacteria bacterium]|nr:antitoxin family protein [Deltaproteobacteria bacterium]
MSRVITAIFENGVFKPLEEIPQIKEHEEVEIKILAHDEWQKRFNNIIEKIRKKTAKYSPEEIEADITDAVKEVRGKRHGR